MASDEKPTEQTKLSFFLNNKNYKKKKTDLDAEEYKKYFEVETAQKKATTSTPQLNIVEGQIVLEHTEETLASEREEQINSCSFLKKQKSRKWGREENELFYEAIQLCGTDFSLIAQIFFDKERKQLKNKFNREERTNPEKMAGLFKKKVHFDIGKFNVLKEKRKKMIENRE